MKGDKLNSTDTILQNKSAADHMESDLSVSAPAFNPTAQLKPAEEEEEQLQLKKMPFQMKGEEEEESLQMKGEEEEESLQLKGEEEEESLQMKGGEEEEEELQLKKSEAKPKYSNSDTSTKTALPENVQMKMEGAFGADFSNVNIHSNSSKAQGMGAQAYAQGNDVHFAPGKYSPESQSGQELIGHELTHVVQQRQGKVQPTTQMKGQNVNADKGLENEADQMGKKAALGEKNNITSTSQGNQESKNAMQLHPDHGTGVTEENTNDHTGESTSENETETSDREPPTGLAGIADSVERFIFDMQNNWGPRSLVPPIFSDKDGYGGFEASYNKAAQSLNITVRGKTRFTNGLTDGGAGITSNQEDLDQLANVLNIMGDSTLNSNVVSAYTWNDETKEGAKEQFKARLGESIGIWENTGMEFFINRPGWEDISARLSVNLEVEEEGSLGDTASREAGGQHQQINIYKTPNNAERSSIRGQVNAAILKYETDNQMSIGRVDSYDVRAYVDGQDDGSNYADDNAHNGAMHLSSNDLGNSQGQADSGMLSERIFFDHDSETLSQYDIDRIKWKISSFKGSGDANLNNNSVKLIGHTSSSGSEEYNNALAKRRIDAVKAVLQGEGISKFDERYQESNQGESGHNANPEHDEAYHRAVDIKIGSGETQNTVAHEFGHVFGLADEYEEDSRTAGDASGHNKLSNDMGTGDALVENNDGIISMGNTVRAQHYSVFAWSLRELTGKEWSVRNQ